MRRDYAICLPYLFYMFNIYFQPKQRYFILRYHFFEYFVLLVYIKHNANNFYANIPSNLLAIARSFLVFMVTTFIFIDSQYREKLYLFSSHSNCVEKKKIINTSKQFVKSSKKIINNQTENNKPQNCFRVSFQRQCHRNPQ